MKKIPALFLAGILILIFTGAATAAGTYEYSTNGLNSLDHYYAYSWKIDLSDSTNSSDGSDGIDLNNEEIVGAYLFFDDIYDNTYGDDLYISLLDDSSIGDGVVTYGDGINTGNYFQQGDNLLFQISDMGSQDRDVKIHITDLDTAYSGWMRNEEDWIEESPNLTDGTTIYMPADRLSALIDYAQDGIFGLGFDPDCHYYTNGVTLVLETIPSGGAVPEPETLLLFGIGLIGVSAFGRKRMNTDDKAS